MANVVDQLLTQLRSHPDIEIERSHNSGHWKVCRDGRVLTTIPSTMFDGPATQAVLSSLRRHAGIDLSNRQPRSGRPKKHKPKPKAPQPYTKKTAAAALDELRQELLELSKEVRTGDRDPSYYQRVHELVCEARRAITDL